MKNKINGLKRSFWARGSGWALCSAALAAFALGSGPLARARGGGGNGVPSPFVAASNHKVELADGELYTLQGKIVIDSSGDLYFNVDLKKHPWLANAKRIQDPYYRVQSSPAQWEQYEGRTILLVATAHVVVDPGSGSDYEVELQPVNSDPARSIVKLCGDYRSSPAGLGGNR